MIDNATNPLLKAVLEEDIDGVKKAIADGADVNEGLISPLMNAAALGNVKIVNLLLENGADPEKTDQKGNSSLHYGVMKTESPGVVATLLSSPKGKALLNKTNKAGMTPVVLAVIWNHKESLKTLLNAGGLAQIIVRADRVADLEDWEKDLQGKTALEVARDAETKEILRQHFRTPKIKSVAKQLGTSQGQERL